VFSEISILDFTSQRKKNKHRLSWNDASHNINPCGMHNILTKKIDLHIVPAILEEFGSSKAFANFSNTKEATRKRYGEYG
jgi:hypothetical protein